MHYQHVVPPLPHHFLPSDVGIAALAVSSHLSHFSFVPLAISIEDLPINEFVVFELALAR